MSDVPTKGGQLSRSSSFSDTASFNSTRSIFRKPVEPTETSRPTSPKSTRKLEEIESRKRDLQAKQLELESERAKIYKSSELKRQKEEAQKRLEELEKAKKQLKTSKSKYSKPEPLDEEDNSGILNKLAKSIGIMNIVVMLVYTIGLIAFFIIVQPNFIYDYPEPKSQGDCKYQYCFDSTCNDMTAQDLRNSVKEGMRKLNMVKLISWFAGIWISMLIIHLLISKVGLLNIGTKAGRCNYRPIGC